MKAPPEAFPEQLRDVVKRSEPAHTANGRGPWKSSRRWQLAVVGILATAAVVWLIFSPPSPPTPDGWGWQREGVFAADLSDREYLLHLSDSANQWFNKPPVDAESLRTRLVQFRDGCDRLISAAHPQLEPDDRRWLVERCRLWSEKLDAHIAALDQGRDLGVVRREADQTVMNLIQAIEARADEIS